MRRSSVLVLLVVVAGLLGSSVGSFGAVPSAHGQIQGSVTTLFGGIERTYDIRLSFNVRDMAPGEGGDFGTLSGRLFDPDTGKMCAVFVASDMPIVDVLPNGDVYFVAVLRLVTGSFPVDQRRIQFWAHDGDVDAFRIGPFPVTINRGFVTARTP